MSTPPVIEGCCWHSNPVGVPRVPHRQSGVPTGYSRGLSHAGYSHGTAEQRAGALVLAWGTLVGTLVGVLSHTGEERMILSARAAALRCRRPAMRSGAARRRARRARACAHKHTHTHARTHTHTHTHTRTHTHRNTHARTHTHTRARTYAHAHTRAHTHTYTRTHTHTNTNKITHSQTHIHTHS
jgi:hypothetical protein